MNIQNILDTTEKMLSIIVSVIFLIKLLRNTSMERARLILLPYAITIEFFVIKNKTYFNFTFNVIGQFAFALCIVGATCNYLLGGNMATTVGFIILGIAIRWLYSKFIVA